MTYKILFRQKGFQNAEREEDRMNAKQILKALQAFNEMDVPKENMERIMNNWPCEVHNGKSAKKTDEVPICTCDNFVQRTRMHYQQNNLREYEAFYYELMVEKHAFEQFNVRVFMMNFDDKKQQIIEMQTNLRGYLSNLQDNVYIKKILGGILSLGNILNAGNKSLEQADGFDMLTVLSFCKKKDNNKDSALYQICVQVHQEDNDFKCIEQELNMISKYEHFKPEEIKQNSKKLINECNKQSTNMSKFQGELVQSNFGNRVQKFLNSAIEELNELTQENENIDEEFETVQNWFMFPTKKEDAAWRADSKNFFEFWNDFMNEIKKQIKSMNQRKVRALVDNQIF